MFAAAPILSVLAIVLASVGFCTCVMCCCCGLNLLELLGSCLLGMGCAAACCPSNHSQFNSSSTTTARYELVSSYQGGSNDCDYRQQPQNSVTQRLDTGNSVLAPSAPIMAEAYWVAPLVSVHVIPEEDYRSRSGAVAGGTTPQPQSAAQQPGKFHDAWAAILLFVDVIIILWLAVSSTTKYYPLIAEKSSSIPTGEPSPGVNSAFVSTLIVAALQVIITTVAASIWLGALINYPKTIIESMMWAFIIFWSTASVFCFIQGAVFVGVILLVVAGISTWYYYSVKNRIPFASSVLSTASKVIQKHFTGISAVSYSFLLLQLLWSVVVGMAVAGLYLYYLEETGKLPSTTPAAPAAKGRYLHAHKADDDFFSSNTSADSGDALSGDNLPSWLSLMLLLTTFSYYWGIQVLQYIVSTTISGVTACWWFQPEREYVVKGALLRASTTSLGSICFGALLVAILQTLQALLRSARERAERRDRSNLLTACMFCCLQQCLQWLEQLVQYFNKYAFCYVAGYGMGFLEAGKKVTELFIERGWHAVINDNLISNALLLGIFVLGLISAITSAGLSLLFSPFPMGALTTTHFFIGFVIGLLVGGLISTAINSSVAMIFVCLAEDPSSLQKNHPSEYMELINTWYEAWPDISLNLSTTDPLTAQSGLHETAAHSMERGNIGGATASTGMYYPSAMEGHLYNSNEMYGGQRGEYERGSGGFSLPPASKQPPQGQQQPHYGNPYPSYPSAYPPHPQPAPQQPLHHFYQPAAGTVVGVPINPSQPTSANTGPYGNPQQGYYYTHIPRNPPPSAPSYEMSQRDKQGYY